MKQIAAFTTALFLVATPVTHAQETEPSPDWSELQDLLERFSQDSQEFLQDWLQDFTPLLEGLRDKVDDISQYEPPEVLPNGDIIIRRKPDMPDDSPQPDENGLTDL